jgi:hypothetical protein
MCRQYSPVAQSAERVAVNPAGGGIVGSNLRTKVPPIEPLIENVILGSSIGRAGGC